MTSTIKAGFKTPKGISQKGRKAAKIIREFLEKNLLDYAPPESNLFMSPKDWKDRGEEYGDGAELILIHEGFDAGEALSLDKACYSPAGYRLYEELNKKLREEGLWMEEMYCWSCAVYDSNS